MVCSIIARSGAPSVLKFLDLRLRPLIFELDTRRDGNRHVISEVQQQIVAAEAELGQRLTDKEGYIDILG
jgi:hypothetical protein